MADTLFCTCCGTDTHVELNVIDDKPMHVALMICREWRCSECLDAEQDAAERMDPEARNTGGRSYRPTTSPVKTGGA